MFAQQHTRRGVGTRDISKQYSLVAANVANGAVKEEVCDAALDGICLAEHRAAKRNRMRGPPQPGHSIFPGQQEKPPTMKCESNRNWRHVAAVAGGAVARRHGVVRRSVRRWWRPRVVRKVRHPRVLCVHCLLVSSAVDSSANLAASPLRRCVHLIWALAPPSGFSRWLPVPAAPSAGRAAPAAASRACRGGGRGRRPRGRRDPRKARLASDGVQGCRAPR